MAGGVNCGSVIGVCILLSVCLGFFVVMPVTLVLFSSPSAPSFSVNLFHNQTFNMTTPPDASDSVAIHFDLKLKNENQETGLHYPDQLNITFSYFPNVSMLVILGVYKLDSFYQGNGKTRHVRDAVELANGIFPRVLEGTDMIVFRVDLVGSFRYKKAGTKRHKVELGCVVAVDSITSNKMQKGFIGLVEPGLDSKLKVKEPPHYAAP